jgi:hypothetical protein
MVLTNTATHVALSLDDKSAHVPEWIRCLFDPATAGAGVRSRIPGSDDVRFLPDPSSGAAATLSRVGYTRLRRYVALPSSVEPRWLLPIQPGLSLTKAFAIYTPYTRSARIAKQLVLNGVGHWLSRRRGFTVASRSSLPLERLVEETTGEAAPVLAAALGTPGPFQKVTALVMTSAGATLGYIKLPVMAAAVARLRSEAAMLEHLSAAPRLRAHVPRVIHAERWGDGHVLFQSALSGSRGPVHLTRHHRDFLTELAGISPQVKRGPRLVADLGAEWCTNARDIESSWHDLGRAVLARAAHVLNDTEVACGIGHGDFAPWNTRLEGDRLLVFDWESARADIPLEWDAFHFQWQAARLLGHHPGWWREPARDPRRRALLSLFLLDSIGRTAAAERTVPSDHYQHRSVLQKLLSRGAGR